MWKRYRLLASAALVAVLATPLWLDGSLGVQQVVAQRLESFVLPSATAVAILPVAQSRAAHVPSDQFEAARLLVGGTMLFGLAAVLRRAI